MLCAVWSVPALCACRQGLLGDPSVASKSSVCSRREEAAHPWHGLKLTSQLLVSGRPCGDSGIGLPGAAS